ncbi:MAG TPA: hypothetical protein VIC04_05890 [Terriglobia bacterium]
MSSSTMEVANGQQDREKMSAVQGNSREASLVAALEMSALRLAVEIQVEVN